MYGLSLAVTIQGHKSATLGGRTFEYGPGHRLLTNLDSPVVSRVTQAEKTKPYLGMLLRLAPLTSRREDPCVL
jgi:hypothetical protein